MNKTVISTMELIQSGETLSIAETLKSRVSTLFGMAFLCYMMFGVAYYGFHKHNWFLVVIFGLAFFFFVLLLVAGITQGEKVVLDKASGQVLRKGKPTGLIADIVGVNAVKLGSAYNAAFVKSNGKREIVIKLSGFKEEAEAKRYAAVIAEFLGVATEAPPTPSTVS